MDKFTRQQIDEWVFKKVQDNPKVYGGDKSNPLIMKAYIQEFHNGKKAELLEPYVFSILSTVSRRKNTILINNPQFDYRKENKPKKKKIGIKSADNAQG